MTVIIDGGGLPANNYGTITIEKSGINKSIAAVGVRITGTLLADKTLLPSWVLLREILVEEPRDRIAQCVVTGTDPPASIDGLYNLAVYNKTVGSSFGIPKVITDDAGECSEIEARAAARQLLQAKLRLANRRTYVITAGVPSTLPQKGDTVRMPDAFEGVVVGYKYSVVNSAETLTLDLVNFNAAGY